MNTVRLFELPNHPGRVALSKLDSFVVGGTFFLDFSRPLEKLKRLWLVGLNRRFGLTIALVVPVIHETESDPGGYIVGVHRSDPAYDVVRDLWRTKYPSKSEPPTQPLQGLKIIADFARQFPDDSKTV